MRPLTQTSGPRGASAVLGFTLCSLLAACAVGPDNVQVQLPAYAAPPAAVNARGTVRVEPLREARRDAVGRQVGQRTGLGGISMGQIELSPSPAAAAASVLLAELKGLGFTISDTGAAARLAARLTRFEVRTPATALYWDIHGAVDLEIDATGPGGRQITTAYQVRCTDRTYAWPSEELIAKVLDSCLKDLGGRLRADGALASLLATP